MSKISAHASLKDQRKAAEFVKSLKGAAQNGATFDSAAANEFVSSALNLAPAANGGIEMPDRLQAVLDEIGDNAAGRAHVVKSVLDGANEYERRHGKAAPGDLLMNALQIGYSLTREGRKLSATLDAATTQDADPISLHPSAPAIGMMTAIAQAMPFAAYAPADIKSNEGRIIIISHQVDGAAGTYAVGDSLDGTASGEPFMTSSRVIALAPGATMATNFRAVMTDYQTPNSGSAAVAVLPGRCVVYVQGKPVAYEVNQHPTAGGASTVAGFAIIAGVTYTIGGTVTPSTGAVALTSSPALPGGTDVAIEGFIDFENGSQSSLAARLGAKAQTFKIFANPERGIITATPDAQTQFDLETGFSALTVASEQARIQFYNERHYRALRKLYRIAANNGNVQTFDFKWSTFGQQKTRAQIWADFFAVIGIVSQQMAIDTVEHGITHMYVPANIAQQMAGLPREIFEPSGLTVAPGIYRVGRLYGTYEVYYCPKVVASTSTGGEILCIGTSPTTARNPIVVGDAVAPTFTPRGVLDDMKQGYNFYSRGFTEVNPHGPSSLGAALIEVTNLF
jgi:hypothetical protein